MKIVFTSLATPESFLPITFYDRTDWFNFYLEHPVEQKRLQRLGERVVFLTHVENLLSIPQKVLLQTDLPNEDGLIHFGAIFKPSPFFIGCDLEPGNATKLLMEVLQVRGSFKMTIYDNNGITSVLNVVSRSLSEGVVELENTSLIVDKQQETKINFYIFSGDNSLFPGINVFPGSSLFPMNLISNSLSDNGSTPFYVSEKTDYLLEFENTTSVSLTYDNIKINNVDWNAPDTILLPSEKIVFSNNPSNYPYDTPNSGIIYKKVGTTYTQIGTFDTNLIQNNNSIVVNFDVTNNEDAVDSFMTMTVYSKGTSVVPG